ncbi:hypothetical protein K439DRAFT_1414134 [Ramaria rubella]|nr:hypothetical protein K439DRAFT_1414134 [Ramaria rubella]
MTATDEHPVTTSIESLHSPQSSLAVDDTPKPQDSSFGSPQDLLTPAPFEHTLTSSQTHTPNAVTNSPIPAEQPADPKVAALLAMFPDFDSSLLQSVLESVSGDQDRAVDVLLGMSDPSYNSTERADATQTELDEEIARRLMLEESEQHVSWRPRVSRDARADVPYQPRTSTQNVSQGASQQRPSEGDSVAQFQEQLGRFAETGKKTFNTIFSKVKAKMQEFDNPSGQGQPSVATYPVAGGDSWNAPAQSQSHSYYDPLSASAQGYDMGPAAPPHTSISDTPGPATQPTTVLKSTSTTPVTYPSPSIPPGVPSSGTVDPTKIGLLPKRPVSLGSSPQPSRPADDDELEYVENPFEESTRH